jgi:hypothetical protein
VTKPLTDQQKQQRKRVRARKKNAAKSTPTSAVQHTQRFITERKQHGMMAAARVVDVKRQRGTAYLLTESAASSLAYELNSLEEFKAVMKNVVTMRDIVAMMLAIEAAPDLTELTKACDRNRELLYRLEVGPFKPTSHSQKATDEEDHAAPRNAPTGEEEDIEEDSTADEDEAEGKWRYTEL